MNGITRAYRDFVHSRKFAKIGKGCRFIGRDLTVEGHVEIGDYCRVREDVKLRASKGAKIVIGNRCLLSWNVIVECGELIEIHDGAGLAEYVRVRTRAEVAWLRVVAEWFEQQAARLDRELASAHA